MAITLDSFSLSVITADLAETDTAENRETDFWSGDNFKRGLRIYRKDKVWNLTCLERNTLWNDSVAKQLYTSMLEPVAFIIDEDTLEQVNVNVYIMSIEVTYQNMDQRIFTLILREKED